MAYLKLTNRQVGLLINFGAPMLREGLRRTENGFPSLGGFAAPREPGRYGEDNEPAPLIRANPLKHAKTLNYEA